MKEWLDTQNRILVFVAAAILWAAALGWITPRPAMIVACGILTGGVMSILVVRLGETFDKLQRRRARRRGEMQKGARG